MDKQMLFYNNEYQFYYSFENKTISSPQISGKQNDDYSKSWVICFGLVVLWWVAIPIISSLILMTNIFFATLMLALTCILNKIFFKFKTYFIFSLKWIWYVAFVPFYYFWSLVVALTLAYDGIEMNIALPMYVSVFIVYGIVLTYKKSIKTVESEEYVDIFENKKMLRDVLISNDVNYKGIIILEVILCAICFFYSVTYSWLVFFTALPIFIVAVFQRNIYYLFLIHKIAKQYGISLKSKDVLEENDAEAEKQINAENKANEENGTNTKNISTTENEINTEDYTITPKDTSTQSNSIQNLDKPADKQ